MNYDNCKQTIKHLLLDLFYALLLYKAITSQSDGYTNILIAINWLTLFCILLVVSYTSAMNDKKELKELTAGKTRIPRLITNLYDVCILTVYAWYGWWVMFIVYLLTVLLHLVLHQQIQENSI